MRYNSREKCIEAKEIILPLSTTSVFCAIQVGNYKNAGIAREIEAELGIEIEGDNMATRHWFDSETAAYVVKVYDNWAQPTRR